MRYLDVQWIHDTDCEPVRFVSEVGTDNYEKRKLEYFVDGSVGFASETSNSVLTQLGDQTVPTLEEINNRVEFSGIEISPEQFEAEWKKHVLEK